jgi:hypothetical protein
MEEIEGVRGGAVAPVELPEEAGSFGASWTKRP